MVYLYRVPGSYVYRCQEALIRFLMFAILFFCVSSVNYVTLFTKESLLLLLINYFDFEVMLSLSEKLFKRKECTSTRNVLK